MTTNTTSNMTLNESNEELSVAADLGIFAAILFGSMIGILVLISSCILWHFFYMRFLKKPL